MSTTPLRAPQRPPTPPVACHLRWGEGGWARTAPLLRMVALSQHTHEEPGSTAAITAPSCVRASWAGLVAMLRAIARRHSGTPCRRSPGPAHPTPVLAPGQARQESVVLASRVRP